MRPLSGEHIFRIVARGRAMGDATRVRILNVLSRGEQPVGQLAQTLATEPSTVSKHLQVLFNAGLVFRRREASAVIYSTSIRQLTPLLQRLGERPPSSRAVRTSRIKRSRRAKDFRTRSRKR